MRAAAALPRTPPAPAQEQRGGHVRPPASGRRPHARRARGLPDVTRVYWDGACPGWWVRSGARRGRCAGAGRGSQRSREVPSAISRPQSGEVAMGEIGRRTRRVLPVAAIVLCAAAGPVRHGAPQEPVLVGQLVNGGRVLLVGSDAEGGASGSKRRGWHPSSSSSRCARRHTRAKRKSPI